KDAGSRPSSSNSPTGKSGSSFSPAHRKKSPKGRARSKKNRKSPSRKRPLHVEVPHAERVRLDERAARLDFVAHQLGEDLVGGDAVLDLHLEQAPHAGIHGGLPELLGIHL